MKTKNIIYVIIPITVSIEIKKTKYTQASPPPLLHQNQEKNLAETGHIYARPLNFKGEIQRQI